MVRLLVALRCAFRGGESEGEPKNQVVTVATTVDRHSINDRQNVWYAVCIVANIEI